MAFVIAAVTCGIAGALVAQQNQYINSDFITFHLSIFILLLVLFGGAGSMYGPLVGAVMLTLIDALLARWPSAQHFLYGFLLLFALYVMPGGVVGLFEKWFKRPKHLHRRREDSKPLTHDRHPAAAASCLTVQGGQQVVRRRQAGAGRVVPAAARSHPCADRSERRRQEHDDQHADRRRRSRRGLDPLPGQDIVGRPVHAICCLGMGRTFQNLRLFAELSVLDNVMLGRHSRMKNGFFASLFALPALAGKSALPATAPCRCSTSSAWRTSSNWAAGSLPYGLQRRVELARALATEPQLLLLDEPAAGLNPQETAELGQLLVRIGKCGVSILMVEHHMDLVMSISDHVIVLDYGVKIAEGQACRRAGQPASRRGLSRRRRRRSSRRCLRTGSC